MQNNKTCLTHRQLDLPVQTWLAWFAILHAWLCQCANLFGTCLGFAHVLHLLATFFFSMLHFADVYALSFVPRA